MGMSGHRCAEIGASFKKHRAFCVAVRKAELVLGGEEWGGTGVQTPGEIEADGVRYMLWDEPLAIQGILPEQEAEV